MLKKIVHSGVAFLLIIYFTFTMIFINSNFNRRKCTKVIVDIAENNIFSYLRESQILSFLDKEKLNPIKKSMSEIKTKVIKQTLRKYKLIKKAEVYKTVSSAIRIKVYQRIPILRIISDNTNYYLDSDRETIPISNDFTAYVPLANGTISEKYAKEQLYHLAVFLQKNEFWNAQIEQIYVNNDLEIELIPRVGNHCIVLGEIKNFDKKLDNLKFFYEKVLNKKGWNRYSIINLKYLNQIVCTKTT